jgi:hypothetical protein
MKNSLDYILEDSLAKKINANFLKLDSYSQMLELQKKSLKKF